MNNLRSALILCIIYLSSCATYKALDNSLLQGKVESNETYIRLKSGEIIKGNQISFAKDPGRAAHREKRKGCWYSWDNWIAIDDKKFEKDSVCAFQAGRKNYVYYGCTLAQRLRFGKLNLYTYERMIDATSSNTAFVFEKDASKCDVKLIIKNLEEFYQSISDNPAAAQLCKTLFPKLRYTQTDVSLKNLLQVVDKYNE